VLKHKEEELLRKEEEEKARKERKEKLLSEVRAAGATLIAEISREDREISSLRSDLENARNRVLASEAEIEKYDEEIKQLDRARNALIKEREELQKKRHEDMQKLEALKREIDAKKRALGERQQEIRQRLSESDPWKTELSARIKKLIAEREALEGQLQNAVNASQTTSEEVDKLERLVSTLSSELQQLQIKEAAVRREREGVEKNLQRTAENMTKLRPIKRPPSGNTSQ